MVNKLLSILDVQYPIIQGGMGNISNAILTSAVSEAGGLGTIGAGTMTPEEVESIIIETKNRTNKSFALNVALTVSPYPREMLQLAIKYKLKAVSLSAGNPSPYIGKLKEHGIKVLTVVASCKQAKKAENAGADIVVAEGYEAAGINSNLETTTFVLIPQIVDSVRIPVIAAGGIGDGRGLVAAMALGASGVQIGTRLIATSDSPFHLHYKTKIVDSKDDETIIVGRSVGRIRRVLKTPYSQYLLSKEEEGITLEQFNELTTEEKHILGAIKGNLNSGFINSGQIAGLISDLPTVKQLFQNMIKEGKNVITDIKNNLH